MIFRNSQKNSSEQLVSRAASTWGATYQGFEYNKVAGVVEDELRRIDWTLDGKVAHKLE